jgi:hypothetical protein
MCLGAEAIVKRTFLRVVDSYSLVFPRLASAGRDKPSRLSAKPSNYMFNVLLAMDMTELLLLDFRSIV